MLELHAVTRRFAGGGGLGPVDLACERDRATVLIGPSGCGKSTLLRLAVGLLAPDGGEVRVAGERLDATSVGRLRLRVGYVIQEGGLFPHLTARDNAALMAHHLGWERARVAARLDELAALVRLEPALLERYPAELSGGQRQRVSLMRALFLDPELLLLDEPLGALDPMVRAELSEDLRVIFRERAKTVVMVTHDLHEAGYFGHTIVLLRDGHVVQRGTLDDLRRRPAEDFVQAFVRAQEHAAQPGDGMGGAAC